MNPRSSLFLKSSTKIPFQISISQHRSNQSSLHKVRDFNCFSIWPPLDVGKTSMRRYRKQESRKAQLKQAAASMCLNFFFACLFVLFYVLVSEIKEHFSLFLSKKHRVKAERNIHELTQRGLTQ